MWRGPHEVEGKTPTGNCLLKGVKGKGKGKVRNTAIPPNQLKRYIARSQNIPAKSDDEYASESDGDDDQGPPIGTNSPVLSDLIPYFLLTLKMTREFLIIQVVL